MAPDDAPEKKASSSRAVWPLNWLGARFRPESTSRFEVRDFLPETPTIVPFPESLARLEALELSRDESSPLVGAFHRTASRHDAPPRRR